MLEAIERQGVWWQPDKPANKVGGRMVFHRNAGVSLDLIGSLEISGGRSDTLFGLSTDSEEITLCNCIETSSKESFATSREKDKTLRSKTSRILAQMAIIGGHFEREQDILFQKVRVSYTHLDDWANTSGLRTEHLDGESHVIFKMPEPVPSVLDENWTIVLSFGADEKYSQNSHSIEQHAFVLVESKHIEQFQKFREFVVRLQGLFTLLISEPVFPTGVEGFIPVTASEEGKPQPDRPVKIYYPSSLSDISPERIHWFQMLTSLSEIKVQFSDLVKNWCNRYESINPILSLYFGTLYNPYLYIENRFLSLVQSVESYHRLTMRNYVIEEDEHEARITEILNSIDPKYQGWLKYKLTWSNEPDLSSRLKEVFDKYLDDAGDFLNYGNNAAEKIVQTRNYLTHFNPKLKEKSASRLELLYLTQILKKTLEVALLTELGFTIKEAKKRTRKGRDYRNLLSYKSQLVHEAGSR